MLDDLGSLRVGDCHLKEELVSYETLLVTKDEYVVTIKLNRPEAHNAMNRKWTSEMLDVLENIAKDDESRVVIITGGDKVFSVGADIKEMTARADRRIATGEPPPGPVLKRRLTPFDAVDRLDRIVIAAMAGHVVGGGLELALVCDLRIAASNASFGLPEVKLGVIPQRGGTWRLPALIGAGRAKEFMLLGEQISAERALEIGLVNKVVKPAALMAETMSIARTIAEMPPLAPRAIKSCINTGLGSSLEAALEHEARVASILGSSADRIEGMKAFVEKRKPEFKGR